MVTDKAHLTAIARAKPSAPARLLQEKGLLIGRKLDYGCGRGKDAEHFRMVKYDPYYCPNYPTGKFDTITCIYVLNVIESLKERIRILNNLYDLLHMGGNAYIVVRKRVKEGQTSRGTYQTNIKLNLPVIYQTPHYCIYLLEGQQLNT